MTYAVGCDRGGGEGDTSVPGDRMGADEMFRLGSRSQTISILSSGTFQSDHHKQYQEKPYLIRLRHIYGCLRPCHRKKTCHLPALKYQIDQ